MAQNTLEDNSLMFVPYDGGPKKDAAIRKQIRKQVMQHVGRKRRKAGLIRPKPLLQCALEVPDGFTTSTSATNPDRSFTQLVVIENVSHTPQKDSVEIGSLSNKWISDEIFVPEQALTLDRIDITSIDPFARYPTELDQRAQELIWTVQTSNIGPVSPFKVMAFRMIWMEVSMVSPAAFHQYLAGAQAFFDYLHSPHPESESSQQVILHRACSLKLVNKKMEKKETAGEDGVLAALILLARYYQMIGDFETWRMHMLGLKEIICLRGDIDSIGINSLLRHMISNIDISGSFALSTAPIFPIPSSLLPPANSRPTPMLDPLTRRFMAYWRSTLPNHSQLLDLIQDIANEKVLFQDLLTRTNGKLWTDTMYVCHYINPLLARLLSLPDEYKKREDTLITGAFRLGAGIYLATIRFAFGITPLQPENHVQKIQELLQAEMTETTESYDELGMCQAIALDTNYGWEWIKIWLLACVIICRPAGPEGVWVFNQLRLEMTKLNLKTWNDLQSYIGFFLYIPEVHGVLLFEVVQNLEIGIRTCSE